MKTLSNILISHLFFLSLFGLATYAFAEEDTAVEAEATISAEATIETTPEERPAGTEAVREKIQEREAISEERQAEREANQEERVETRESLAEERQIIRDERRVVLQAEAQARITNLAANISNRIDAAIVRMQNIIDRIETRIDKLEERGVDTSAAASALAEAQISVDAAKLSVANIDAEVALALSSEDVRSTWSTVKTSFGTIRDLLKDAHANLRVCVSELKKAVTEFQEGYVAAEAELEAATSE